MNPEKRYYNIEVRAIEKDGEIQGMSGSAAIANSESETMPLFGGENFNEILEPGAFERADVSDVIALLNHEDNAVLGRTTANTLEVTVTDPSLDFVIREFPNTTHGNNAREHVKRKELTKASFAFTLFSKRDGDEEDGDTWENRGDGNYLRRIKRGGIKKVYDVSPVWRPAYRNTSVSADLAKRSFQDYKLSTGSEVTIEDLVCDGFEVVELEGRKAIVKTDKNEEAKNMILKRKIDAENQNRLYLLKLKH